MTQEKALEVLKTGANVFLTGEPGSGKTFTINKYIAWLEERGRYAEVTASTGIAATHINGSTIHSWCGIGTKSHITDEEIEQILSKPWVIKKLAGARVLIIDEISMLNAQMIEDVDRILSVANNTVWDGTPFGGLQVIFVGDFYQLPPVSKEKKKPSSFAFEAKAWESAKPVICYLTEQHRQSDPLFLEILTALRQSTLTEKHISVLNKHVRRPKEGEQITKLYTHNKDVDAINAFELSKIKAEQHEFEMIGTGIPALIEALKRSCISPEILKLKKGALVMFTRNKFIDDETIYVNGTIGTVVGFENGRPVVETKDGKEILVEPATWEIKEKNKVLASITQIPLRLAWAITVHKSQGMSLDAAMMDLSKAFEFGQGYVALSRVRSLEGLYLVGFNEQALKMHPKVIIKDAEFRNQQL